VTSARRVSLVLLTLSLCLACAFDPGEQGAVVRDSLGIQIVENRQPVWGEGEGWRVSPEPLLDLGAVEGDPVLQFHNVSDATRLSDGRVVVANGGSNELRYFDAAGEFLLSVGRDGEGPGEFRVLVWIEATAADSVVAYDWDLFRISVVDPQGTFVRSYQIRQIAEQEFLYATGLFADGSLLAQTLGGRPRMGAYRDTLTYYRLREGGAEADRLGRFVGGEKFFWSEGNNRGLADHPFGRASHTAAGDGLFLHGTADAYELALHALDGSVVRLVRKQHTPLRVTAGDIEAYREDKLSTAREFWAGLFPHITFPEAMPAYRRALLDREGHIWVEEYRRPSDDMPRWTVFTPDGQLLGTLTAPKGLWIYEIGADYLLGRWRDELDVEHVRLYNLRKIPEVN